MNLRPYQVGHNTQNDKVVSFFVTDCLDDKELQSGKRPHVPIFPVSQLHDHREQEQRANQYAAYMNKVIEATQKAYEQTVLMDLLKQP